MNTVSHQDEDTARASGVILQVSPADLAYMARRASAVCAKTGKVIMQGNIIFIDSWLKKRGFTVIRTAYRRAYDRTNL